MKHGIAVVVTDGIGREILETTQKMFEIAGVRCEWEIVRAGRGVMAESGTPLPDYVLKCIKRNGIGLKLSFLGLNETGGGMDLNITLRRRLKLYSNICQIVNLNSYRHNLNVLVIRENQEGSLGVTERKLGKDVVQCTSVVTRRGAERISRLAFNLARKYQRRKVTLVHQMNQMKISDGLYLECSRSVAQEYSDIVFEDIQLDQLVVRLVEQPSECDLLLVPPNYALVVTGLCRVLAGQSTLAYEGNLGDEVGVFECTCNLQQAEPLDVVKSVFLAGGMLLQHLGEREAAERVIQSVVDLSQHERARLRGGLNWQTTRLLLAERFGLKFGN